MPRIPATEEERKAKENYAPSRKRVRGRTHWMTGVYGELADYFGGICSICTKLSISPRTILRWHQLKTLPRVGTPTRVLWDQAMAEMLQAGKKQ